MCGTTRQKAMQADPEWCLHVGSAVEHIDPGPQEQSEEFLRRIYEQRQIDLSSDRNSKTRR